MKEGTYRCGGSFEYVGIYCHLQPTRGCCQMLGFYTRPITVRKFSVIKNVLNAAKLDALFAIGSHTHRVLSAVFYHHGEKLLK